jgi:dipeptidyl aminopeptidase/acylaminoacyl peptidase
MGDAPGELPGIHGLRPGFRRCHLRRSERRRGQDVLYAVDAALRRYEFLDPDRLGLEGGSYGGQLTNWIVTQTDRFKAAIPRAGIANLVSFNYMAYYHDYLAVEYGAYPTRRTSWTGSGSARP